MVQFVLILATANLLVSCSSCQSDEDKDSRWEYINGYCASVDLEAIKNKGDVLKSENADESKRPLGIKTKLEQKCENMVADQKRLDEELCFIDFSPITGPDEEEYYTYPK